ncbi:putative uncharacterized protein FLJ37770 [Copidosoma floridanum]|uniref:putative uncharacterized protein FLJ37770 n=1 Tax=Copidosoma floridanum TaxID=29053 RepID=UPI0006C9E22F|nr:putative uncharacterized protein FLJ37770 [Copidosoma floridanum]
MSTTQVQLWYNRFKEGRGGVNDDVRPGSPRTSTTDENIEAVKIMILNNGMKRAAAKIVLKLLNFEQKQHRIDIAQKLLNNVNDDPDFLKKVITGDKSWVYGYDIETKAPSSQWKHPEELRPRKKR